MIAAVAWMSGIAAALPVTVLAIECFVGVLAARRREEHRAAPPFTVLMPAHDEARVIARSVRNVRAQMRDGDQLIVIADNCGDDTAAIARGLGATVVERFDDRLRGKGYALDAGRAHVSDEPERVVIVIDADCSPRPGALQRLAATVAARGAAVQGLDLLEPPAGASATVRVSCFAFLVKNLVRQLALRDLAGVALLQGTGMAFPQAVFRRLDWRAASLVEDLDLGLTLLLNGDRVVFQDAALFVSDASSQAATVGQRRRWEHGVLQSMLRNIPALVAAGVKGRPRLLVVALDQMVPPTVLLIAAALVAELALLLVVGFAGPALLLLAALAALGGGLFAAWLRYGREMVPPRMFGEMGRYLLWKLPITLQFLTRRERQWLRTDREP